MPYYIGIDANEGADPISNKGKECIICRYWYFNHGFKFQDSACTCCHDLMILCLNIRNIAIIIVENVDYRFIIHKISKFEAINLLENSVLEDGGYIYKILSDFWLSIVNLKNVKHLKKKLNKKLMPLVWHP